MIVRNQDLVSKVIANKLNTLSDTITTLTQYDDNVPQPAQPSTPPVLNTVSVPKLAVEVAPNGFRRTSRPETYENIPAPKTVPPPATVNMSATTSQPTIEAPVQFPE